MSEEILINGKKITELSDMFFEYCKLKKENEELKTYIQKMDKPEIKTIDSEIALKNIELQKENESLKSLNDFNVQKIEVLQEENEKLKEKNKELLVLSNNGGVLLFAESTKNKKYKQALEEIREVLEYYANSWVNPLQYPDLHYNSKKAKDALLKVDEVLNDRN